jgi:hypothetical protein
MDVAVAYLHPNQVGHNFHQSMLQMVMWDFQNHQRLGQYLTMRAGSGGIVEARNQLAEQFLQLDDQIEWLFWIDADMGFPADGLQRLLEVADPVERPVVGGLCFAWKEIEPDGLNGYHCVARPTLFDWVEHSDGVKRFTGVVDYPRDQVVQCAATGTAFLLMHRSAVAAISEDQRPFDRLRGTDGSLLGEDISACVRLTAAGIPIHVHTGVHTNHLKEAWISEAVYDQERIITQVMANQQADART